MLKLPRKTSIWCFDWVAGFEILNLTFSVASLIPWHCVMHIAKTVFLVTLCFVSILLFVVSFMGAACSVNGLVDGFYLERQKDVLRINISMDVAPYWFVWFSRKLRLRFQILSLYGNISFPYTSIAKRNC